MGYQLTLVLESQPDGVYTVTCEELPSLITEGDSIEDALHNAVDCFFAVYGAHQVLKRPLPESIIVDDNISPQRFQTVTPKETLKEKPFLFQATLPEFEHAI